MPADEADTVAVATQNHAFEPRDEPVMLDRPEWAHPVVLPPNPHLCRHCRLAKAAHVGIRNEVPPARVGGAVQTAVD